MPTLWFILVAFMLSMYVLLDGFDLGAGIIHLVAARTDSDRRLILRAIGPVWDGNEVWLIAAGGTLFFTFPLLYASSFSGFYLPLIIVLWLLIVRGVAIEMRSQVASPVWTSFWDGMFFLGSALLAIFFGAALGNVIRGVPLNAQGYFFEALWTDFNPFSAVPGILDWYTILTGLLAFTALMMHGANYIAVKTEGVLNERARRISLELHPAPLGSHFSADRVNRPAWRGLLQFQEERPGRLALIWHVHPGNADHRCLQPVSAGFASCQPGIQPDHQQCLGLAIWSDGWPDLVERGHRAGVDLLCYHLPPLLGQGHSRIERRVLRLVVSSV